ncbi:MAG: hypothetical protein IT222_10000 [Crocinitomix sp.]|nr:hypothetical protein [Crocinitomix sp.]
MGLFITLFVIIFIAGFIYLRIKKSEHKKLVEFEPNWLLFEAALRRKDLVEIKRLGEELVYNPHIKLSHLERMAVELKSLVHNSKDLKELELLVYNKILTKKKGRSLW